MRFSQPHAGAAFLAGMAIGGACVAYVGFTAATRRRRRRKVFVSGCFDLLHSGHVAFFKEAAQLGDLYVSVGNDKNVTSLKAKPMFPEEERVYMVQAIRWVHTAFVAKGMGHDQGQDLDAVKPDIFFVNHDGDREDKRRQCAKRGIEYIVASRAPDAGLEERSSTSIKAELKRKAS
jgi:cytidyltransferase-like protein